MDSTPQPWLGITQLANVNPNSTLPPLPHKVSHNPWFILGAAQYLALSDPNFDESLGLFVKRIMAAWNSQQWLIIVNTHRQPWAFITWCVVSASRDEALRQGASLNADAGVQTAEPYLRSVDIIAPFGHHEAVQQHWDTTFAPATDAFNIPQQALAPNHNINRG